MKKQRMNNKKLRLILIPIMAFFMVAAIVATAVADYFTPSLDTFLGKGEREAVVPAGTEDWDSEYYTFVSKNSDEALKRSLKVAEQIADEGIVLLKNDGTLPLTADTVVTPFGYRYQTPLMSGSGSGGGTSGGDAVYSAVRGITEAFKNVNGATLEAMNNGTVSQIDPVAASGEAGATAFLGSAVSIFEFPVSTYAGLETSCNGTVGLVFLGRAGGEGGDLYADAYVDGTPHELALTDLERETLAFAKANCDKVVVILNSCNTMEVAELADDAGINAIVTMCTPGTVGFKSLGKILNGTVNPLRPTMPRLRPSQTSTTAPARRAIITSPSPATSGSRSSRAVPYSTPASASMRKASIWAIAGMRPAPQRATSPPRTFPRA